MQTNKVPGACCFACLMFLIGCGLEGPIPSGPKHNAPAPTGSTAEQKPAITENAAPAKSTAETKPGMVREKAAVGMGEKGRGYGGGMVTTPVKAMFAAREQIVLNQMYHALDLYKASNDGHAPKTHEEFMEKIIKENNLKLPTLPEGHRYVYDPSKEELMVEKPAP